MNVNVEVRSELVNVCEYVKINDDKCEHSIECDLFYIKK